MFANWIDPVVKDYLFHDSPLRKPAARRNLLIVLVVTAVLSLFGWPVVFAGVGPLTLLVLISIGVIGSIVGYLILSFLDRERRVAFFHFLSILSVMFFFALPTAFINELSGPPVKYIIVGFNEEFFKILPVLLFAI